MFFTLICFCTSSTSLPKGETWLLLTKHRFPHNPLQWGLLWFSLPLVWESTFVLTIHCHILTRLLPWRLLVTLFFQTFSISIPPPPSAPRWFPYGLHVMIRKSRISLCLEIFLSIPWLWPLKNMRTGPNPHSKLFKCWGFPSPKSYPYCDRAKMIINVFQTSPTTSCHRGIRTARPVLWAFMIQNPEESGRAKGDLLAGDGEEFWSKRKRRNYLRLGYPQSCPDGARVGADIQSALTKSWALMWTATVPRERSTYF